MGVITVGPDQLDYVGTLDIAGHQFKYAGNGKLKPGALPPNWKPALDRGIAAIVHRILNGTSIDESFALGYDAWLDIGGPQSGLDYGAYVYLQPGILTAARQHELLQAALEPYPDLTVRTMADFEAYNGNLLSPFAMGNWLADYFTLAHDDTLYAGHAFANINTVKGHTFTDRFTYQPRYNRQGTMPPPDVTLWAKFPRWDRQPVPNGVLGGWDAWQFSSDGDARAYGCPIDGSSRIDCNLILASRYAETLRPVAPPPPPEPDPIPIPIPIPDPGPVIPPGDDDMTLYCCYDANGTGWVGDGVKRRPLPSAEVLDVYIMRSSNGTGPILLNTSGQQVQVREHVKRETSVVVESLGEHD